jgi:hypothetical protein
MPDPGRDPAGPAAQPVGLDDVMLAMDVVDTLRHQDELVARELDDAPREQNLMERLRRIYRGQGIEVPDHVLAEGVKALAESRFVYTPPRPSLGTMLARIWVARGLVGKAALGVAAGLMIGLGARYWLVVRPGQESARAMQEAHDAILALAPSPAARQRADRILADGLGALEAGKADAAAAALASIRALGEDVPRAYSLRIVDEVSKQVPTALHRRNYYLVVEAVSPDGGVIALPKTSEETGQTKTVSRWAIKVPVETFVAVDKDRRDDGIVQNDRLGEKRRGEPDATYSMPVDGAIITEW